MCCRLEWPQAVSGGLATNASVTNSSSWVLLAVALGRQFEGALRGLKPPRRSGDRSPHERNSDYARRSQLSNAA